VSQTRKYSKRTYATLNKSFYDVRDSISDAISARIEELSITQTQAAEIAGITQPRMSRLMNKWYTKPAGSGLRETVTAWSMLEVLMHLGAHLTIDLTSYGSPEKGSIRFVTHD